LLCSSSARPSTTIDEAQVKGREIIGGRFIILKMSISNAAGKRWTTFFVAGTSTAR
jgi:hypothetical protein